MAPDCEVIEVVPAFTRMPSTEALVAVPLIVIGPLVLPIAVVPLMKSMPCWPEPMPSTTMEPVVVEKVTPAWTLIPSALAERGGHHRDDDTGGSQGIDIAGRTGAATADRDVAAAGGDTEGNGARSD